MQQDRNLPFLCPRSPSAVLSAGGVSLEKRLPSKVTIQSNVSDSSGGNQQQGVQSHVAGADVRTEDRTGKDPGGTALLSSACELGLSWVRQNPLNLFELL